MFLIDNHIIFIVWLYGSKPHYKRLCENMIFKFFVFFSYFLSPLIIKTLTTSDYYAIIKYG